MGLVDWCCTGTLLVLLAVVAVGRELPSGVSRVVIPLEVPVCEDSAGGIIAADINDDGAMELLVTAPGYLGAYSTAGSLMWSRRCEVRVGGQSESEGLPGHHGPGVQAGDVDGDGRTEVVFLTQDSRLHVVAGQSGAEKWSATPPCPSGAERWEHVVIANFRGIGDRDLLLQATNRDGYRMGRYVAAYAAEDLQQGLLTPLWQRDDFVACAHNGARVADLDGDGRDEVIGGTILGPDGEVRSRIPVAGHIDSVFVYDVRPELPGLEVVALEEGGRGEDNNRVFLMSASELLFQTHYQHSEPQNAAVGQFDPDRPGLQIWCRSRHNEHQKPFLFDAQGDLIAHYEMDDVAPEGWTVRGVEVIWCIDWTGNRKQLAAAKERHKNGDVCIFDALTGQFLVRIPEQASRLYVADVTGDWREELVVWNGSELHIYANTAPNPRPDAPRLWEQQHYRRSKMTYNYYSP